MTKMSKKQLKKQLEDEYFMLMVNQVLGEDLYLIHWEDPQSELLDTVSQLESEIYGEALDVDVAKKKVPTKNAIKRYKAFKNSPLFKALS